MAKEVGVPLPAPAVEYPPYASDGEEESEKEKEEPRKDIKFTVRRKKEVTSSLPAPVPEYPPYASDGEESLPREKMKVNEKRKMEVSGSNGLLPLNGDMGKAQDSKISSESANKENMAGPSASAGLDKTETDSDEEPLSRKTKANGGPIDKATHTHTHSRGGLGKEEVASINTEPSRNEVLSALSTSATPKNHSDSISQDAISLSTIKSEPFDKEQKTMHSSSQDKSDLNSVDEMATLPPSKSAKNKMPNTTPQKQKSDLLPPCQVATKGKRPSFTPPKQKSSPPKTKSTESASPYQGPAPAGLTEEAWTEKFKKMDAFVAKNCNVEGKAKECRERGTTRKLALQKWEKDRGFEEWMESVEKVEVKENVSVSVGGGVGVQAEMYEFEGQDSNWDPKGYDRQWWAGVLYGRRDGKEL